MGLTHGLAVAVGVAAAAMLKERSHEAELPDPSPRLSDRRAHAGPADAEALLATIQAEIAASESNGRPNEGSRLDKRFRELWGTLAPTGDPEATFLKLLAAAEGSAAWDGSTRLTDEQAEAMALMGARYAQWFELDPKAALAAFREHPGGAFELLNGLFIHAISKEVYQKQGLHAAMDWLGEVNPSFIAWQHVTEDIGKAGDLAELQWLQQTHPEFAAGTFADWGLAQLGNTWPVEDRDTLVAALSGAARANVMVEMAARLKGREGVEWLASWIESGELSALERKRIAESGAARRLAETAGGTIDERFEVLRELGAAPGGNDHALKSQMIAGSLHDFLTSGDDWLYRFRSGEVSAAEVMDAALAACPEPGGEANEMRSQVFRHLAEDDLDRAMALFDGASDQEKEWQKTHAAHWWFNGVDPDRFYELVASIPTDGNPEMAGHVRQGWIDKSRANLERFGEDYAAWVVALPQGPNRTWALEGLRDASKTSHPGIYQQANALLGEAR